MQHTVAVTVNVINGNLTEVGHILQKILSVCSIFLKHVGSVNCTVDEFHRYSQTFLKGYLKYPAPLPSLHET